MADKKQKFLQDLVEGLNHSEQQKRIESLKSLITLMTEGKDVSSVFMEVLKNMETNSMQIKKLTYIYITNYAKSFPDLAIMGINTFRKDAVDKRNPLLRALSVRTMGCLKVKEITAYLGQTLHFAIKDQDPFVRKTAAICVAKLYDINPQYIQQNKFIEAVQSLTKDPNTMVIACACAALLSCSQTKGQSLLPLDFLMVQRLLISINQCSEWSAIYLLEAASTYIPKNATQADQIMDRIVPKLANSNSGIILSSVKILVKFMDYLGNADSIRSYSAKLLAPLCSLINRIDQPQISFVALKNLNLILQKRPNICPKEIQSFIVKSEDPIFIKLQKLNILGKIANNDNFPSILYQLKQYTQQIDVQFVKRVVQTLGRIAIKLQKMADKCVTALYECMKSKMLEVVQECIVVIRDVFRKYPGRYKSLIAEMCQDIKSLEDNEAKAAIVWIIGQYIDYIQNANQMLESYAQNFKDESQQVQQQILASSVKLLIKRPSEGKQLVQNLIKMIQTTSENPDLRDRAFIYFRLLKTSPQLAAKVIFCQRPALTQQTYQIQSKLLDELVQNIGTLSSIYYKPPYVFVKKIRDLLNAKVWESQLDGDQLLKGQEVNYFGDQPTTGDGPVFSKSSQNKIQSEVPVVQAPVNKAQQKDLLSQLLDQPKAQQKIQNPVQKNKQQDFFDVGLQIEEKGQWKPDWKQVLGESARSLEGKVTGVKISARFKNYKETTFLDIKIKNVSFPHTLNNFAIKFNSNSFSLAPISLQLPLKSIPMGGQSSAEVQVSFKGQSDGKQPPIPFLIDVAVKTQYDVLVFKVPCLIFSITKKDSTMTQAGFQELIQKPNSAKTQDVLQLSCSFQEVIFSPVQIKVTFMWNEYNGNQNQSFRCYHAHGQLQIAELDANPSKYDRKRQRKCTCSDLFSVRQCDLVGPIEPISNKPMIYSTKPGIISHDFKIGIYF